ncbi:MAG: dihydrodipicolinate synthase family protein [Bryobacteraceae bacterium]
MLGATRFFRGHCMGDSKQPLPASGVYAALATPLRPNSLEGDAAALLDYLDAITRAGVDGLVLFGATGEFVHFDVSERMRLLMFVVRRSRVPVLVNVSHSTLVGAVDLAEHAVEVGAAGVLLMPPYFYVYGDSQLARFYEDFVRLLGGKIPIYLYNLPSFTNRISAQLAEALLMSGAFAGIKDSSGEWQMFETLNALQAKRPFKLLIGNESLYLRALAAGAHGIVSGVAAAIPELPVAINEAFRNSKLERAQQLNAHLQQFVEWLEKFPTTVGIKQTAAARGWKLDQFAVPLDDSTSQTLSTFRHWLENWIPMILAECTHKVA